MYACATLQNLCHDPGWSQIVVAHGLQPRIEELATTSEDPLLVRRPPPRLAAASRARPLILPLLPSLISPSAAFRFDTPQGR